MKKLLTLTCLLILASCSTEVPEISDEQLVERQGIKYEVNSATPFTGSSVSYHANGQIKKRVIWNNGREGEVLQYYENGQLKERVNYKDGIQGGELDGHCPGL